VQATTRALTISEVIFPKVNVLRVDMLRGIFIVLGFTALTAICAQIKFFLPDNPIPITGQTFAVLLTGALLGSRLGAITMLTYVASGTIGLPVFALPSILGPSGGYLIGFVFAAFVVGWLAERGWDRRVWTAVLAMAIGNLIIYLFGLPWLAAFIGFPNALTKGVLPFIPGDIIKLVLAVSALRSGWALLGPYAHRR